ncbi:MAG: 4Fe-4S binding protein, partial [Candidatus Rokubacteria bacterium]|nr:4Fe-4S binding protein [Candidatus Rokubacteria bacterium]
MHPRPLVLGLVLLALPALAVAHGGGHGAARSLGGGAAVAAAGYEVTLQADPAPLAAGEESRVIAKVVAAGTSSPVTGGTVRIGLGTNGHLHDFLAAPEVTWAGSYTAAFTPARRGAHHLRVLVDALDGRTFEPPLAFEFSVDVGAAPGLGWLAWIAIGLSVVIGGAGLYGVAVRARTPATGALDLLSIPWLRALLTSSRLQTGVQVAMLVLTVGIAVLGFVDVQDGGVNLATKLTWTLWWPGIIFTFVLAGRVWCVACPFGALNEWSSRATGTGRRLPRIFRNVWWATGAFVVLTWADEQLGVVRSPIVTAWIVIAVAAVAILVGLRYERRSFCRHLCPIGGLIGIYSMTAPVELRARDTGLCRTHAEKSCYRGGATSRGCPMLEFPQTLDRNNYCTLCGDCVKGCDRGNLVLRLRTFGKDLWATSRRALDEAYLAVALVGLTLFVTAGMLTAWPDWISAAARWLPGAVRTSLKPVTYLGLVETMLLVAVSLVIAPLLVLGAAAVATRRAGAGAPGARRAFVLFGYMFVPVGLAMHLAHNLAHLLLEGGGLLPAVQRAVARYTPISIGEPDWHVLPLAPEPVVGLLQMAIIVGFFGLSLVAGHRLALRMYPDSRAASRALLPFAALSLAFT